MYDFVSPNLISINEWLLMESNLELIQFIWENYFLLIIRFFAN